MLIAVATRPAALLLRREGVPLIVALGVGGLALVQWSYFFVALRVGVGTHALDGVLGTIVPFALVVAALQPVQLSGAAVTLAGVSLALSSR